MSRLVLRRPEELAPRSDKRTLAARIAAPPDFGFALACRPCSLAAVFRPQLGLPFIGPDRLA